MILIATAGRIEGGWEYIWVAYAVSWLFLGGYALSLWLRSRSPREDLHE